MRAFLFLAATLAGLVSPCSSTAGLISESRRYRAMLERDGFPDGIGAGAFFYTLYKNKHDSIVFFDNYNPEDQHGNQAIVVLKGDKLAYVYSAGGSCWVVLHRLRCREFLDERLSIYTDVSLTDLFRGKQVLLDGDLENPAGPDPIGSHKLRRAH